MMTNPMTETGSSPARPNVLFVAGRDSGVEPFFDTLASHPEIGAVAPADFADLPVEMNIFPPHSFDPAFTFSADCADAFETIAQRLAGTCEHILWSPAYAIEFAHVVWCVSQYCSEAHIIICLRDPVAAAWTRWHVQRKNLLPTIEETIERTRHEMETISRFEHRGRWTKYLENPTDLSLFLQSGVYAPAVRRYRHLFDADCVFITAFESFETNPSEVLRAVAQRLGVDEAGFTISEPEPEQTHIASSPRAMLESYYTPFNETLREDLDEIELPWV